MLTRSALGAAAAVVAGLLFLACSETPASPEASLDLDAFGRSGGEVTLPIKIQLREGSFVVVPFGDSRIPEGTPTDDCPVGDANPDLGVPAGFPNGGGVVVSQGTGEATHLGRVEFVDTRCAVQFHPVTEPPFVNFDVRTTYTGADGDQIFVRAPFALTPFTPPEVQTPIIEIVGGTGRFEGATGQLSPSGELNVTCTDETPFCLAGTFTGGTLEGELTIPRP